MFDINVHMSEVPTDLCRIMEKYRGDKGGEGARHNYTRLYCPLFEPRRLEALKVFELGIFCGASLRAWRDYFPNAAIYGADINPGSMVNEDRIKSFLCDETDAAQVVRMWNEIGLVDIIIDDGLHTFNDNLNFALMSFKMLNPGGVYIIEDLTDVQLYEKWANALGARIVQLPVPPGSDATDNAILILVK